MIGEAIHNLEKKMLKPCIAFKAGRFPDDQRHKLTYMTEQAAVCTTTRCSRPVPPTRVGREVSEKAAVACHQSLTHCAETAIVVPLCGNGAPGGRRLGWAGLGWAGLDWAGLGWAGLVGWLGPGWARKERGRTTGGVSRDRPAEARPTLSR